VIPTDAILAAKEAMREVTPPFGTSKADWFAEHGDFALIAGVIAAAAPHMLAAAWEAAVVEGEASGWLHDFAAADMHKRNPYRPVQ
jgi:hypothetical protein